jgi:hypothetical protein
MPSIVDALRRFEHRALEADSLPAPPVNALVVESVDDQRLNRQLAVIFAGLLEQPTVTHRIDYLHRTADRQEEHLADYCRKLVTEEAEQRVTPAVWSRMVATLRKWATEIHDDALAGPVGIRRRLRA